MKLNSYSIANPIILINSITLFATLVTVPF